MDYQAPYEARYKRREVSLYYLISTAFFYAIVCKKTRQRRVFCIALICFILLRVLSPALLGKGFYVLRCLAMPDGEISIISEF